MKFKIIVSNKLIYISNVNSYGESDSQGNPCSLERESHNLINLARMFPVQYKTSFMNGYSGLSSVLSSYSAVPPLYMDNLLNRMSKAHSFDMSLKNCFSHSDCNGTSIGQRFNKWSTEGTWAENIAAGNKDGISTNNQLICDSPNGNKVCTPDGSGQDGHRKNIMSEDYQILGLGYYYTSSSTYKTYWTQDFTSSSNLPTNPIYSGYHTFYPSATIPKFIAMVYSKTQTISTMSIVFVGSIGSADSKLPMELTYGNPSYAAYTYTPSTYTVACQQYYFQGTTSNGTTIRYPDTGYLQVSKDTTCLGWSISSSVSLNVNLGLENPSQTEIAIKFETSTPKATYPPQRNWNWFWDYKLLSKNNNQQQQQQQQEEEFQQDEEFYSSTSKLIVNSSVILIAIFIISLLF
ncbi:hypothetical protein ACTFIR_009469 [Dictyostelium discoideum]